MNESASPFLRWVGGKRKLLPTISKNLPETLRAYHEPFLGGGAPFFGMRSSILREVLCFLSDSNSRLIQTYIQVRDNLDEIISHLETFTNTEESYYTAREEFRGECLPARQAALLIYLNRTCFNGVYRENSKGQFNVPYGKLKNPDIVGSENLRAASKALQGVSLESTSFEDLKATPDAFYYLDPPYHKTYSQYTDKGFGEQWHLTLAQWCATLDSSGAQFLLSNSDTELTRDLYSCYDIQEVLAPRSVSRDGSQRVEVKELLIKNY